MSPWQQKLTRTPCAWAGNYSPRIAGWHGESPGGAESSPERGKMWSLAHARLTMLEGRFLNVPVETICGKCTDESTMYCFQEKRYLSLMICRCSLSITKLCNKQINKTNPFCNIYFQMLFCPRFNPNCSIVLSYPITPSSSVMFSRPPSLLQQLREEIIMFSLFFTLSALSPSFLVQLVMHLAFSADIIYHTATRHMGIHAQVQHWLML